VKAKIDNETRIDNLEKQHKRHNSARHTYQDGYRETMIWDFLCRSSFENHAECDGGGMSWYGATEGPRITTARSL
jgi:hypothetical protein